MSGRHKFYPTCPFTTWETPPLRLHSPVRIWWFRQCPSHSLPHERPARGGGKRYEPRERERTPGERPTTRFSRSGSPFTVVSPRSSRHEAKRSSGPNVCFGTFSEANFPRRKLSRNWVEPSHLSRAGRLRPVPGSSSVWGSFEILPCFWGGFDTLWSFGNISGSFGAVWTHFRVFWDRWDQFLPKRNPLRSSGTRILPVTQCYEPRYGNFLCSGGNFSF